MQVAIFLSFTNPCVSALVSKMQEVLLDTAANVSAFAYEIIKILFKHICSQDAKGNKLHAKPNY